jgi:hypothetical protein
MKLTASVVGSLALFLAAACERRTETTPEPAPGTTSPAAQDRTNPSTTPSPSAPGATTPSTATPESSQSPNGMPSAATGRVENRVENPDTVPVRGMDSEPQGSGGTTGSGGQGGHAGHAGHGGKANH